MAVGLEQGDARCAQKRDREPGEIGVHPDKSKVIRSNPGSSNQIACSAAHFGKGGRKTGFETKGTTAIRSIQADPAKSRFIVVHFLKLLVGAPASRAPGRGPIGKSRVIQPNPAKSKFIVVEVAGSLQRTLPRRARERFYVVNSRQIQAGQGTMEDGK